MSIKKTYPKSGKVCKVTFDCPEENADNVYIVGDFNEWTIGATPMKKAKKKFTVTLDLEPGREYEYRFVVDGERWISDDSADGMVPSPFPGAQNSVVSA